MSACAYWVYLFGGCTLFGGFFFNTGADAGWFSYVPLSGPITASASARTSGTTW
jgi:cytochrome c oxidase subunit 1